MQTRISSLLSAATTTAPPAAAAAAAAAAATLLQQCVEVRFLSYINAFEPACCQSFQLKTARQIFSAYVESKIFRGATGSHFV
jgi:hypothetical protein